MKKILSLLLITTLSGCVVTPHTGVKPYIPSIQTKTVSISKDGLHIPNIIYPIEVDGYGLPVYIDTGSISLEDFLCKLEKTC